MSTIDLSFRHHEALDQNNKPYTDNKAVDSTILDGRSNPISDEQSPISLRLGMVWYKTATVWSDSHIPALRLNK